MSAPAPLDVLMVGTGEYTTGYTDGGASKSDKGSGVVALTLFDLRTRTGKVGTLSLAGVRGAKFPGVFPLMIPYVFVEGDGGGVGVKGWLPLQHVFCAPS